MTVSTFTRLIGPAVLVLCGAVQAQNAAPPTLTLDIPAQKMTDALNEFARQSGLQVLIDWQDSRELTSPRISGTYTPEAALQTLLADSGLQYQYLDARTISVRARKLNTGSAAGVSSSMRLAQSGDAAADMQNVQPSPSEGEGTGEDKKKSSSSKEEDDSAGQAKGISEILVLGNRTLNTDIRRTEDDAQPVVVFGSEEIQSSGASDIMDFFKTRLPMDSAASSLGQSAAVQGVQASNGTTNLRGLGVNQTLILVDGRRIPGVASTGGTIAQPNISGIPLAAIERIEVLPSTAGGIYGGGATGGVINVILKRDYTGLDLQADYGNTFDTDVGASRLSVSGGVAWGERHPTSITFSASHAEQNTLLQSDRSFQAEAQRQLLRNNPSFSTVTSTSNICSATQLFPGFGSCNGVNLVLDNGTLLNASTTSVPYGYGGPSTDNGTAFIARAGQSNRDVPDFGGALLRPPERNFFEVNIRQTLWANVEAYLEYMIDSSHADVSINGFSASTFIPASAPQNPFQQDVAVTYSAYDTPFHASADVENQHGIAGLIVRLPGGWSASLEHAEASSINTVDRGGPFVTSAAALSALVDPVVFRDLNANPVDLSSAFSGWSGNSAAESHLESSAARFSGPFLTMPGGAVTWSGLLERREENVPDEIFPSFGTPNRYQLLAARSQSTSSAYLEARAPIISETSHIPLVRSLELQVAARHDEYEIRTTSDSPTAGSPSGPFTAPRYFNNNVAADSYTYAIRYEPIDGVILRASLGTGFLAPSLGQLGSVPGTVLASSFNFQVPGGDPRRGNQPFVGDGTGRIATIVGGNPDIQPEDSTSLSYGFVIDTPFIPNLRISADYTSIEKSNEIVSVAAPYIIANEASLPGRVTRGPNLPGDPSGYAGPVVGINSTLINALHTRVEALDLQLNYDWQTDIGMFSAYAAATRMLGFDRQSSLTQPNYDSVGFNDGPLEWRGTFGARWENGPWTIRWDAQYFDGYSIRYSNPSLASQNSTIALNQGSENIPEQIYHDASFAFRLDGIGHNPTELMFGVQNIFDHAPPIISAFGVTPETAGYSTFGDPRMRRFTLSLRTSF